MLKLPFQSTNYSLGRVRETHGRLVMPVICSTLPKSLTAAFEMPKYRRKAVMWRGYKTCMNQPFIIKSLLSKMCLIASRSILADASCT